MQDRDASPREAASQLAAKASFPASCRLSKLPPAKHRDELRPNPFGEHIPFPSTAREALAQVSHRIQSKSVLRTSSSITESTQFSTFENEHGHVFKNYIH